MSTTQNTHESVPQRQYRQPRGAWSIVARREILTKLTDKAFITGTLVTLVALLGGLAFGIWQSSKGTNVTIAVTDEQAAAVVKTTDQIQKQASEDNSYVVKQVKDAEQARQAVTDGDADAWLNHTKDGWKLVFHRDTQASVMSAINSTLQNLSLIHI